MITDLITVDLFKMAY